MTSFVRVLTTTALDASPSLLLVSPDGSKILVDCGEGCQRTFIEFGQKVASVQAVCLTQVNHESVGGLPGFILTASDIHALNEAQQVNNIEEEITTDDNPRRSGAHRWPFCPLANNEKAHLHMFGPLGTRAYVEALRHFARRSKFKVRLYEGACETIPAVPESPPKHKKNNQPAPVRFSVSSMAFEEDIVSNDVIATSQPHAGTKRPRPDAPFRRQTLSYLFATPPIVGKFLPQKAMELGVRKGPMFAQLKAGQSVNFTDANGSQVTVQSHQVVTPSSPGIAILVLRYPQRTENLDKFYQSLDLTKRLHGSQLDLVIHLALPQVFRHKAAEQWRQQQSLSCDHLYMNLGIDAASPHLSAASTATVRSMLCPAIFRSPWTPTAKEKEDDEANVTLGKPGVEYHVLPRAKRGFVVAETPSKDDSEAARIQQMEESGARELAQSIIATIQNEKAGQDESTPLGSLLFAGTASALPCKYRNVTGMLLCNDDGRSMLLDVGEGTVGQLLRMQTSEPDETKLLASITVAWISHPHADHHLGLLRLLEKRRAPEPLLVIAPPPIFRFLQEYADGVDPNITRTYRFLDCRAFREHNSPAIAQLNKAIGFSNCQSIQVEHCPFSYAVILDGTPFGRVVYSGDCRPCKALADAAKPADLLIHESTFEDSMKSEAFLKKHCTIGEALVIAKAMEAKCTVLTHFSQRYPRIPPPTKVVDTTGMRIIFAFDFQCLSTDTLQLAAELTPALRKLYPEEEVNEQQQERTEVDALKTLATPGLFAKSELL